MLSFTMSPFVFYLMCLSIFGAGCFIGYIVTRKRKERSRDAKLIEFKTLADYVNSGYSIKPTTREAAEKRIEEIIKEL